jgi:HlyD family secretion protein
MKEGWRQTVLSSFELLDGRTAWSAKFKPAATRLRQGLGRALPHGIDIWWAILFGLVLVVSGYLRLYDAVGQPAPASGDSYIHLLWFKGLEVNRLYPDGLYPSGGYALLQVFRQFTVIDGALLLRLMPGLVGVLLVTAIYWTVTRLTGRRGPAIIAAALYGMFVFARWLPQPLPPQGDLLTVELALLFLLPTFVFLAEALAGQKKAPPANPVDSQPDPTQPVISPAWLFFQGLACLFLIQPFAGLLALAGALVAVLAVGLFHLVPLRALRLLGMSLLATGVGMAPLLAGYGMGIPIHLGPLRWDVIFFGATLREGRFFPPPPAAPEPLLLFYLGLAGAVLFLVLPGRWLGANRVLSIAWRVFALFLFGLALLYQPAFLNLPELLLPHQVARLLTLVLCAVLGLSLHQILLIVATLSRGRAPSPAPAGASPQTGRLELSLTVAVLVALLLPFPSILIPTPTLAVSSPPKQEYEAIAEQVYRIKEELPPYRWTVIGYPETLSHILGHGYYIENKDFLDNYRPETWRFDPRQPELAVSTPHVFIFTEKHPFVVPGHSTEAAIQRDATQQRLQDWITRYRQLHHDMEIFYEDGQIAVYHIYRTPEEEKRILAAIEAGLMPTHIPPPAPAQPEGTPAPGATPGAPAAPTIYTVQRGQIESQVLFDGQIAPAGQQELAFGLGGRVAKVYVAPGDTVKAGDLLAGLDTTQLEQNLALAQMDLEIIQASQQAAEQRLKADLEAAQLELEIAQLELQAARLQAPRPPQAETAAELERAFKALQDVEAEYEQVQQALFSPEGQNEDVKRIWGTDWMWLVMRNAENLEMATSGYYSETLYYDQARQDKLTYNNYTLPISQRYVDLAELRLETLQESLDPAYQKAVERAKLNVDRLEAALAEARQPLDQSRAGDQLTAQQALIADLEQELDSAQAELERDQADLAAAEQEIAAELAQAELDLQTAERNLQAVIDQQPALEFSELEVETNLEKTKQWLEQAQAEYNQVIELGTPPDLFTRLHQARMDHIQARAAYQEATSGTAYDAALLEQAVTRAETKLAELEAQQGQSLAQEAQQTRLALEKAEQELAAARLVAPLAGQVLAINLVEGIEVEANRPVAVVASMDELEVVAGLAPAQIQRLEEGLAVTISPLAAGASQQSLEGYIRYLPPPTEAESQPDAESLGTPDRLARIALADSATEAGYQAGDRVQATVWLGRRDDVLWLPPRAIQTTSEGQNFVIAQDGGEKRQVMVELGLASADRVEILSGLSEGQEVVRP